MNQPLRLTLFGSPQITYHGQPLSGFVSTKVRALLIYLAVTARPQSRDHLAHLLWEDTPASMKVNLRKALSNLRALIGDVLLEEDKGLVALAPHRCWVDVGEFERLCQEAALAQAAQLYQADFLDGFNPSLSYEFESWALAEQSRLKSQMVDLLRRLATQQEQNGHLGAAILTVRRLLALEPWHEESHRWLMTLLAKDGQRSAALAHFEVCKRVLQEELAAEPDVETVKLVESLQQVTFQQPRGTIDLVDKDANNNEKPLKRSSTNSRLPAQATRLLGREDDQKRICDLLTTVPNRLVTLVGPPGIGKTTLALAVAARLQHHYGDGVIFVPLAAISDAMLMAATIVAAVSGNDTSARLPKIRLIEILRHKIILLVLDNLEQISDAAPLIAEVVAECPGVCILATSRERLHLRAEQRYRVPPIDLAPAIELFVRRAQAVNDDFVLTSQNQPTLEVICQRLDCLPLALELAADWVDLLPLHSIVERIQTNLDLLETTFHDVPTRHRSMRACYDTTWALLAEQERQSFIELSVFSGGFTLDAAEQVAGVTVKRLSALANKSLIEYLYTEDRYKIHELLRQYGREQLVERGGLEDSQRRHAEYYLSLAERAEAGMRGSQVKQWLDRVETEHNNIRAVLAWARDTGDITTGLKICGALRRFWHFHGHTSEEKIWFEKLLPVSAHVSSAVKAKALITAGAMNLFIIGDVNTAHTLYQESLELYQQVSDVQGAALALMELGNIYAIQYNYAQATQFYQQSMALYRESDDLWGIAVIHIHLGYVALNQGDHEAANSYLTEGLRLQRDLGDLIWITEALDRLASVAAVLKEYGKAAIYLQEVLVQWRELDDKLGIAAALNDLGRIALYAGDLAEAKIYLSESFAIAQTLGYPPLMSYALSNQGNVAFAEGAYTEALHYYTQSLQLFSKLGDTLGIAKGLERLASVAYAQEEIERAITLLSAATNIRKTISVPSVDLDQTRYDQIISGARSRLNDVAFVTTWTEGESMTLGAALAYAMTMIDGH